MIILYVFAYAKSFLQAKLAIERWEVAHSDFLTPPAISDVLRVLKRLSDVGVVVSGGYPQVMFPFDMDDSILFKLI